MTTVYTNSKYSNTIFNIQYAIRIASLLLGICGLIFRESDYAILFISLALVILILDAFFNGLSSSQLIIDEEKMVVFERSSKETTLNIVNLNSVVYKYSKKGRFRKRIIIVEDGAHEIAVDISKNKADEITAHLKRLNPAIEVKESTKFFD